MRRILLVLFFLFSLVGRAVELGDSRADVIAVLGEPESTLAAGKREFLNYADVRIILVGGEVDEIRGQITPTTSTAEPTSSAPPEASATSSPRPAAKPSVRQSQVRWLTDLNQAKAAADKSDKRILALFTGTDWCPPCQMFEAEVAKDEQFAGIFGPSFVFFKNDWLRNTPQPPAIASKVAAVQREYEVSQFPTLMILDAAGEELDTVDWTSVRGASFKEAMIEAIDDSRKATEGGKKASSSWWPF